MRMLFFLALMVAAGCATQAPRPSPDATAVVDAPAIGRIVADYVGSVLPPATTTVWISMIDDPKLTPSAVRSAAVAALRDRGFAVAESAEASGGHPLRFDVVPLDRDVLVRVELDQSIASRLLARDSAGVLAPASPVSVRSGP